jgi:hypothetical protein
MRKGAIIILAVLMASLLVSQVDALAFGASRTGGVGAAGGNLYAKVTVTTAEKSSAIDSGAVSHHSGFELDAAKTSAFTSVKAVAIGPCGAGAEAAAGAEGVALAI